MTPQQLQQLITQLSDGEFHSGEALAGQLGVSRAAVWKRMQAAMGELGLEIDAVRGRGYRLAQPLELFDETALKQQLLDEDLPGPVLLKLLQVTDSTNRQLLQAGLEGAPTGSALLAEHQTAGRGRRGRVWISPFGTSIYLSLLHRSARGPAGLSGLSIAAGVAVADCLSQLGVPGLGLKWPNDLLWDHRKLGGLLVDVVGEQGGSCMAVIGLGLNLRMSDRINIDQPWIDLRSIPNHPSPSRNLVAGALIAALVRMVDAFEHQGLGPFLERWREFDLLRDRPVELLHGDRTESGICRGIDSSGALLLEQQGLTRAWHGGEVSLRGAMA